ncbi:MAG: hypothetical protein F6K41_06975 [Symploca sp. SIO3E6]|nr:hypothetical protein [Caldora sp. SIO3E6]
MDPNERLDDLLAQALAGSTKEEAEAILKIKRLFESLPKNEESNIRRYCLTLLLTELILIDQPNLMPRDKG